jgi:hypothetical protein
VKLTDVGGNYACDKCKKKDDAAEKKNTAFYTKRKAESALPPPPPKKKTPAADAGTADQLQEASLTEYEALRAYEQYTCLTIHELGRLTRIERETVKGWLDSWFKKTGMDYRKYLEASKDHLVTDGAYITTYELAKLANAIAKEELAKIEANCKHEPMVKYHNWVAIDAKDTCKNCGMIIVPSWSSALPPVVTALVPVVAN